MQARGKRLAPACRKRSITAVALIALISCLVCAQENRPAQSTSNNLKFSTTAIDPKRVLILESFGRDFAVWNAVPATLKSELAQQLPLPIEFHEAALETARADQPEAEAAFAEYLRALYARHPPDLVVPVGAPAAHFLWRHRSELFPHAPVLIGGIDERLLPNLLLSSNDTAVLAQFDLAASIQIVWELFPATTNLVMVFGDSPLERLWVSECRKALQPYTNRLHITWLNELSLAEMSRRVATLPPRSVIGYGTVLMDAAGVPHEELKALEQLCSAANVPVFGTEEEELGHGIIGGSLTSGRALGVETARLAARILRGEPPGSIPPSLIARGRPIFDWRELQRWQVSDSKLPPGSVVRFRQASAWHRYKGYILIAVGIMIAQAATILGLILQRARRRAAEATSHELAGRLISIQENERREIAGKLHDGLGQDLLVIASQAQLGLTQTDNPPVTVARLNEIALTARQAVQQVRQMAHNLRPGLMEELGFTKAVQANVDKAARASGLSTEINLADVDGFLPPEFEVNLFRICQEALNNVIKHAGATHVKVMLTNERAHLRLVVEDNGCGFDPGLAQTLDPTQRGVGLHEIRERAKTMRGRVVIRSHPGEGTHIAVEVPRSRRDSGQQAAPK